MTDAATAATTNPLALSDEDFLKQNAEAPGVVVPPANIAPDADVPGTDGNDNAEGQPPAVVSDGDDKSGGDGAGSAAEPNPADAGAAPKPNEGSVTSDEGAAAGVKPGENSEGAKDEPKPGEADPSLPGSAAAAPKQTFTPPSNEEAQAFFMQIMTPFKANGKLIELKKPEEAIALMQMGANYTRKMQELQPHRKMLMMLQNNDLLDEGKLSFLIDLDKKNPEAIKKLVKDAGIDPLDIDSNTDPAYTPGSHAVTDQEANFRSVLSDLGGDDQGKETLAEINSRFDQTSKQAIWEAPGIMTVLHEQRQNGVYDKIVAEMDRRITLGTIPANTPFLQAYKAVGDELVKATLGTQNEQAKEPDTAAATTPTPGVVTPPAIAAQPVAVRTAVPKPAVANGDAAAAAAASRASPSAKQPFVNPLAMRDDDFLKQFEGRL